MDTLRRDITDTTVQAIISWLSWITERKLHQTVGQQLEHPNERYHLHLQSTYKALTQPNTLEETAASLDALPASESPMQHPTLDPTEGTAIATPAMTIGPNGLMDHSPTSPMVRQLVPTSEVINQQVGPKRVPLPTRPTRRASAGHKRNYCEEEIHPCPDRYEQPYGMREGVAISQSRLPGAGRGLFGIKPSKHNPLLFKRHMNLFVSTPQCKTSSQ